MEQSNKLSLFEMAKRRIIRNIDMLTDVGDIPYEMLRPIIAAVENPDQLRQIEENSPHIAEKDGEIWLRFIKRDFGNWQKNFKEPKNPKNWHKLYEYLKKKDTEEVAAQQEQLRAALQQLRDDKESSATKVTNRIYDPAGRRRPSSSYYPSRPQQHTVTHFVGGKKVTHKTPKSALAQARREVIQQQKQREGIMSRPQHMLSTLRNRGPKEAPKGWMERNMPAQPLPPPPPEREGSDLKPLSMFAPSKRAPANPTNDALAQREARLIALKEGRSVPSSSSAASASSSSRVPPNPTPRTDKKQVETERPLPHNPSYKINKPPPPVEAAPVVSNMKRKRGVNVFMPSKKR